MVYAPLGVTGALRNGTFKLIANGGNSKAADGWSAQYPGSSQYRAPTAAEECGYGGSTPVCLFDLAVRANAVTALCVRMLPHRFSCYHIAPPLFVSF